MENLSDRYLETVNSNNKVVETLAKNSSEDAKNMKQELAVNYENSESGVEDCQSSFNINPTINTATNDLNRITSVINTAGVQESTNSDSDNVIESNKIDDKPMRRNINISETNQSRNIAVTTDSRTNSGMANNAEVASSSLLNLLVYATSSDDSDGSLSETESIKSCSAKVILTAKENKTDYRTQSSSASGDDTYFSDDESDNASIVDDSEDENTSRNACGDTNAKDKPPKPARVVGELTLDDLPPVPDLSTLSVNVKKDDCVQMGNIESVIDKLVTIKSLPDMPVYDVDTLLFLDEGRKPLGHVYDVIGRVANPMYAIRFNSKEKIEAMGIKKGIPVYSVPESTEHTQYVFVKQLLQFRGTDASWLGDNEVPTEFVEFSDDEEEYNVTGKTKRLLESIKRKRSNSIDKHKRFETAMNLKNRVDSARQRMNDSCERIPRRPVTSTAVSDQRQVHVQYPQYHEYHHTAPFGMDHPLPNKHCPPNTVTFAAFPPPTFHPMPPSFPPMNVPPPGFGLLPFNARFQRQVGHGMPTYGAPPVPFAGNYLPAPIVPPVPHMPLYSKPIPDLKTLPPPPPSDLPSFSVPPPNVPTPMVHMQHKPFVPQGHMGPDVRHSVYPPNLGLPKPTSPAYATAVPPNACIPPNVGQFVAYVPPFQYNMAAPPRNFRGHVPQNGNGRLHNKKK